MRITPGDFDDVRVRDLIALHLRGMHENSPPESVFALDLSGLQRPDVSFYAAWEGEDLLGMSALKALGRDHGEIKSMRTAPAHLRKGVAAVLLEHIIAEAQARGYRRLSLETGRGPAFEPALALYRRRGFRDGEAFADYGPSDFSQYLHLDLYAPAPRFFFDVASSSMARVSWRGWVSSCSTRRTSSPSPAPSSRNRRAAGNTRDSAVATSSL